MYIKKAIVLLLGVAAALACEAAKPAAQNAVAPKRKGPPPGRVAWLKKVGGFCEGQTKGTSYLYLDCTEKGITNLAEVASQMQAGSSVLVKWERAELKGDCPLKFAKAELARRKDVGALTLVYEGGEDDSIEVFCPMDRVALLNVTSLKTGNSKAYDKRILALGCRSFVFTAGGVMPFGMDGSMKNVFSVADVDKLKSAYVPPVTVQLVKMYAKQFGFAQKLRSTYLGACQGGWAPPPTNDLQRAVWERVHSVPDRPIKIEYTPPTPPGM